MFSSSEWNTAFDILYNNVSSNQAPGLSLKEKSKFLTWAQDLILKAYINPKTNKFLEGFDDTSERQIDFSTLIDVFKATPKEVNGLLDVPYLLETQDSWHKIVDVSKLRMLTILNEQVVVNRKGQDITLLCKILDYIGYSDYFSKPYLFPNRYQAWRINNSNLEEESPEEESSSEDALENPMNKCRKYFELIAGFGDTIKEYKIRYIRLPKDIDLTCTWEAPCEVDPILHLDILRRGVELAKAAYSAGTASDAVAIGLLSGTNLGVLTQSKD